MKKIIISATAFMFLFGMSSVASAAKFSTTATTILNGISFSPSTGVGLDAISTTSAWAAAAKHETGGTTQYGLLSTDTNIQMETDLPKSDAVDDQTSATALQGF